MDWAASRAEHKPASSLRRGRDTMEFIVKMVFLLCGFVAVGCVLFICIYLIIAGLPAILEIGVTDFLFGTEWAGKQEKFGILPFILTSVAGTAGAVLVGVPIGLMTAMFLAKVAPPKAAKVIRTAVELLAAIPSVIYGLLGMMLLNPLLYKLEKALFAGSSTHRYTGGADLLAAVIVLAIMILPTVISVSASAIRAVPGSLRAASLALGASKMQTIRRVTVPAAKSGILTGVVLGIGRALGEAMAINMVAGGAVNLPLPFNSVRFLTTQLVSEMGYAEGTHRQVLFTVGLVLYLFIMIVNLVLQRLRREGGKDNG